MPNSTFDMPEVDLYPRDGAGYDGAQYYDEPEERKEDEREAANEQASAMPFLSEIHAWFDEQIAFARDRNTIVPNGPISIEAQYYALGLLEQILQEKKDSFPDLEGKL